MDHNGLIASAHRGTLFLDEIAELPLDVQAKLLKVIEERTFMKVGGTKEQISDFRLIAATNQDLVDLCIKGRFRRDLFDRIYGLPLTVPPLRERKEFFPRIARAAALDVFNKNEVLVGDALAAVSRLSQEPNAWPGNVRELLSFLGRAKVGIAEEERRTRELWSRWRQAAHATQCGSIPPPVSPSLDERMRYAELIRAALSSPRAGGGRPKAAASREVARELASRLLDALPKGISLDEVQDVLQVRERSLNANVDLLVYHGLVYAHGSSIVGVWPPAHTWLLEKIGERWVPVARGAIPYARAGGEFRIELTSKWDANLSILMITHTHGLAPQVSWLYNRVPILRSKPSIKGFQLAARSGVEQVIVHLGPPGRRGGVAVETTPAEPIMPHLDDLEWGRRRALEELGAGWLAEYLICNLEPQHL
jgi:hypothetical protein